MLNDFRWTWQLVEENQERQTIFVKTEEYVLQKKIHMQN